MLIRGPMRSHKKTVLLGVTGGIAAYKSADLVRKLITYGFEVRVVMTKGAKAFVSPLTFQALSSYPVHDDLLDAKAEAAMGHIELARLADFIIIAPASADIISKLAQGQASDLLTTLVLASTAPVAVAPAMNKSMWSHPATQSNIQILRARGVAILGPDSGELACGDIGEGRMVTPEAIAESIYSHFCATNFKGKHFVISAGPTEEPIGPVRLITNKSSGKMGYALAEQAMRMGAEVTLVSGPVKLSPPSGAKMISVLTTEDMYHAVIAEAKKCDIFIGVAAVVDYKVKTPARQKLKKQGGELVLTLVENPDIIAAVAKLKNKVGRPFVVGFAAETERLEEFGKRKLTQKGLDMIAINDVSNSDIGFNADHNAMIVFDKKGKHVLKKATKADIATQLLLLIENANA